MTTPEPTPPDHNAAAFAPEVDDVFARIATRYDTLCDIFSLYLHRRWKARMAAHIAAAPGATVLVVASGTGDIPLGVLRRWRQRQAGGIRPSTPVTIIVSDLSNAMLAMARQKIGPSTDGALAIVDYRLLNAYDLAGIADNSVDVYSISFGMKIMDRDRVMREALRVLKPGGRFFCLEASHIRWGAVHRAYLRYMQWCLPLIAKLQGNSDTSTYRYFLKGIEDFPDQAGFAREIESMGFGPATFENLSLGVVALHTARKP